MLLLGRRYFYDLNIYIFSKFIYEILMPNVMVLEGRAFERILGHEHGISVVIINEAPQRFLSFSVMLRNVEKTDVQQKTLT